MSKISVTSDHLSEVLENPDSKIKFIQFHITYTKPAIVKLLLVILQPKKCPVFPFHRPFLNSESRCP